MPATPPTSEMPLTGGRHHPRVTPVGDKSDVSTPGGVNALPRPLKGKAPKSLNDEIDQKDRKGNTERNSLPKRRGKTPGGCYRGEGIRHSAACT